MFVESSEVKKPERFKGKWLPWEQLLSNVGQKLISVMEGPKDAGDFKKICVNIALSNAECDFRVKGQFILRDQMNTCKFSCLMLSVGRPYNRY